MPPLGALSEADVQLLNDPTRSVKRAQIVSLCRKASLKVKGTNAELIAALNAAAAQAGVDEDAENVDPFPPLKHTSAAKSFDREEQSESSFETVIHIHPKPWSQSTPAPRTRKSTARGRKSTKRKSSMNSSLYPQLSVYPDLSGNTVSVPTTSTEEFGKIAEGILEEMNTRAAGTPTPLLTRELIKAKQAVQPVSSPPSEAIFQDTVISLNESPNDTLSKRSRFSEAHTKIFNQMDSVQTHYAAQREPSESPIQSTLRIPKRQISALDLSPSPSPKRVPPDPERTSDNNLSEQGRDIQNFTRQEFQKRWQKKFGMTGEGEDSIELESRRLPGKMGLEGGVMLKSRAVDGVTGKVIPVKHALGLGSDDSSLSYSSSSRDFSIAIQPPVLPMEEPSILLVPGDEPALPKDKKIPVKHNPKTPQMGTRALVIPAAKTTTTKTAATAGKATARPGPGVLASPTKLAVPTPKFTMGSIPAPSKTNTGRRPLRSASTNIPSPAKPRITRSVSAQRAATGKVPVISHGKNKSVDIKVPVKFNEGKSKRKYAEANESCPAKRMRLNEGTAPTPGRKTPGKSATTPSTALVRHPTANGFPWTPGTVSSRTPVVRMYGRGQRSVSSKPPWR